MLEKAGARSFPQMAVTSVQGSQNDCMVLPEFLQIDPNKRSEKAQLDCMLHSLEKNNTHTKKRGKEKKQGKTGENGERIKYIILQFL